MIGPGGLRLVVSPPIFFAVWVLNFMGRVRRKVKNYTHLDVRNMFALQGHILSTLVFRCFLGFTMRGDGL